MEPVRELVHWEQDLWNRLDEAVRREADRSRVAGKFLPRQEDLPPNLRTVPADVIDEKLLRVDEQVEIPLVELTAGFQLTAQQVREEQRLATAVTLAERATNLLAQVEDRVIFQGDPVLPPRLRLVARKGKPPPGLLLAVPATHVVPVPRAAKDGWGEATFRAAYRGITILQDFGHYGPYALVLETTPHADAHAPLEKTLIMPADRIRPLVTAGFHGTGALPALTGLLISLGGHSLDLVLGTPPTVEFVHMDQEGAFHFRVYERFAVRLKDASAVVKLEFEKP